MSFIVEKREDFDSKLFKNKNINLWIINKNNAFVCLFLNFFYGDKKSFFLLYTYLFFTEKQIFIKVA